MSSFEDKARQAGAELRHAVEGWERTVPAFGEVRRRRQRRRAAMSAVAAGVLITIGGAAFNDAGRDGADVNVVTDPPSEDDTRSITTTPAATTTTTDALDSATTTTVAPPEEPAEQASPGAPLAPPAPGAESPTPDPSAGESAPTWVAQAPDQPGLWTVSGAGELRLVVAEAGLDRGVAWSPNGSRLAFLHAGQLQVVNADGSGRRTLHPRATGIEISDLAPQWSIDGTKVFFVGQLSEDSSDWSLASIDVASDTVTPITTGGIGGFSVSPDGRRIAFVNGGLIVADVDGSNQRQLAPSAFTATWSPNGQQVAVTDGDGISVIDVDSGARRSVTGPIESTGRPPVWSPDGSQLTYSSGYEVVAVDVAAATSRMLFANAVDARWLPGGNRLAYYSLGAAHGAIALGDRTGNTLAPLVANNPSLAHGGDAVWSRTSSPQLAFTVR